MLFNSQKARHAVIATLLFVICQYSHAQQIPPACAQLTRAVEICTTDFQAFQELTNPAAAKGNGFDPKLLETQVRAGIQREGVQAIAERCATEQVKNKILGSLSNSASAMAMAGGDPRHCMRALQQIK